MRDFKLTFVRLVWPCLSLSLTEPGPSQLPSLGFSSVLSVDSLADCHREHSEAGQRGQGPLG